MRILRGLKPLKFLLYASGIQEGVFIMAYTTVKLPGNGGSFTYENHMWKREGSNLKYIGPITNGHIRGKIPYGVTNCDRMFQSCQDLRVAPEIPDTVISADYMFADTGIILPPRLPEGLEHAIGMFENCRNLRYAPELPESLRYAMEMFAYSAIKYCESKEIPKDLKYITNMFYNCKNLSKPPKITTVYPKEDMSKYVDIYFSHEDIGMTNPWYGTLRYLFGF